MAQSSDTQQAVVSQVIASIWTNPSYKSQFLANPQGMLNQALASAGLQQIPSNDTVTVLQNTATQLYYVVPPASNPNAAAIDQTIDKTIAELPAGITGTKVQQVSDADQYFVIPAPPPGISLANLSTRDIELIAAASGSVAVNTTAVANAYVAANAVGVQNAVGATEVAAVGVAVAVVAGVLT